MYERVCVRACVYSRENIGEKEVTARVWQMRLGTMLLPKNGIKSEGRGSVGEAMVDGATESEKFVLQKSPGFAVHPRPGLAKFEHVRGGSRAQFRQFRQFNFFF